VVVGFQNTNYKERHSHSKMVKLGLAPSRARDVVWEMEYDLQQIWGATVSNHYKAYAILIPNKQNKWLVFWCWTASKDEIEPPAPGQIILPVVLINNAGIIAKGDAPGLKVDLETVRVTLETNALGPFRLSQAWCRYSKMASMLVS
jgi:NAD(P)-dependent dehydrogenase (short-subunit alcohol dehydrogenase family)